MDPHVLCQLSGTWCASVAVELAARFTFAGGGFGRAFRGARDRLLGSVLRRRRPRPSTCRYRLDIWEKGR